MAHTRNTTDRKHRHARIRAKISGTASKPRLSVYRSNRCVYAQLIDDEQSVTLGAADSRKCKGDTLQAKATAVGEAVAKIAQDKSITAVVFDRGGFQYHGIVKAVADGARTGGLEL